MKIANFEEYTNILRELYAGNGAKELELYEKELKTSGSKREKIRTKLALEINKNKEKIRKFREELKKLEHITDKKKISEQIKLYNQAKKELAERYSAHNNISRFSNLSLDAKVAACSATLFRKYLTKEILDNNMLGFKRDEQGDVIIDTEQFRNSHLYQEASHIKDYVNSHISRNLQSVSGPGYFKGLLKDAENWRDLLEKADIFLERVRKQDEKKINKIEESREGIEIVKVYPERKLQAVQLFSERALKYEGVEMGHCVGGRINSVKDGTSKIYSLRDYKEEGELIPHTTIEVKAEKITEIKGKANKMVRAQYIEATRDLVMKIAGFSTLEELASSKDIPETEKGNIGFFKDKNGKIHDIFNMIEDGAYFSTVCLHTEDLGNFNLEKINVGNLRLMGDVNAAAVNKIAQISSIAVLNISNFKFENKSLCSLKNIKSMELSKCDFNNLKNISLPEQIENLKFEEVVFPKTYDMRSLKSLKSIEFNECDFSNIEKIETPPEIQNLKIHNPRGPLKHLLKLEGLSALQMKTCEALELKEFKNLKSIYLYSLNREDWLIERFELPKQLEKLDISNLSLSENIKEIDFREFKNLTHICFNASDLSKLERFYLPENNKINHIMLGHSDFNSLEELDLSKLTQFEGIKIDTNFDISDMMITDEIPETSKKEEKEFITGINLQFSHFNKLKKIKFPPHITELNLTGVTLDSIKELDLSVYENLKNVSLGFSSFKNTEKIIFPENVNKFGIGTMKIGKNTKIVIPKSFSKELVESLKKDYGEDRIEFITENKTSLLAIKKQMDKSIAFL